ncbi:hypothetical protein [uncultured Granulicatella sp.]|uniref:hypothetical protein n=1 Tax=uncultured Granulicatella sp. TaxID=316089 RepID=UPI0028DB260A|nr:hypothetical protein [uncultured Granulicatella sp.]
MKKHQLMLASLAVLGAGFLATSSNVQAAEQSNTGFAHKDGKVYYVENGQLTKGWKSINAKSEDSKEGTHKVWIYVSQTGEVQTGWVQDNGSWYYLSELTGEQKGIGLMQKGFLEVNKTWYYFDESGAMKENQWFQQKDGWYYADKSGALKVYEWFQVGRKWYFATEKGTIVTNSWIKSNDEVYHFNESGVMAENEWFEANGGWFYASKSGAILRNTKTPDGYYVNENGQWI